MADFSGTDHCIMSQEGFFCERHSVGSWKRPVPFSVHKFLNQIQ